MTSFQFDSSQAIIEFRVMHLLIEFAFSKPIYLLVVLSVGHTNTHICVCVCVSLCVCTLKAGPYVCVLCTYSWFQRDLGFSCVSSLMLLLISICNNNKKEII